MSCQSAALVKSLVANLATELRVDVVRGRDVAKQKGLVSKSPRALMTFELQRLRPDPIRQRVSVVRTKVILVCLMRHSHVIVEIGALPKRFITMAASELLAVLVVLRGHVAIESNFVRETFRATVAPVDRQTS